MNSLTGTGSLVRLILRRDRALIPIWVLFMALLPLGTASGTVSLYPTDEARRGYIDGLGSSPLLIMFYGVTPAESSLGALIFWRMANGMVVMALIGLLMVIRHTRVEEEAGRRELLGSTVVGRHANLTAALIATGGTSLLVGLLVALGMMSQGAAAGGSVAMGLAWACAGIVFAAIGAVCAQLTEGAGAARSIGISVVGVAFVLRAAADVSGVDGGLRWMSWISPLGWSYEVHAYTDDRWWVFGLAAVFTVAVSGAAMALSAGRDVGAGLLPPRLGPAQASPRLRSPLALAWRLHSGALTAWVV
ncbi:ABC transporter permease, partial [Allorhizocola rhizosphaerae]|uniref:ABC transporter permease n=1 Tax=Allorhizocola rhizosphaerae TaxID=1872709 RepID=UPI003CCC8892